MDHCSQSEERTRYELIWSLSLRNLLKCPDDEIEKFIEARECYLSSEWLGHDPELQEISEHLTTDSFRARVSLGYLSVFRLKIELLLGRYLNAMIDGSINWVACRHELNELLQTEGYDIHACCWK